ncbi:MAG: Sodium/hydrogen exchanger [Thermoanaerobacterales bacterium 50_218]|nr:MAG: Sodium/hydrogen exchanger [Thermoanaerobacterales bacterium 50_218]HAA90709.1 hypothetical protein [Peptococcaceae bacterium]
MDHGATSYASLLIIVLLAAFVPVVLRKIKVVPIPIVVGEIIAGMIVGKSGLNLIEPSPWLNFLSTFGFAFLMFLSGLEIDFGLIYPEKPDARKKWYRRSLTIAVAVSIFTFALSAQISGVFYQYGWISNQVLMTLILSTTSLGIVVPVLKEKGLIASEFGQTVLLAALLADFVTMVLIAFFVAVYTSGVSYQVLLVLLLFVAFFVFYRMGIKVVRNKIFRELAHATAQIEVRGVFALLLVFIALAQLLGTEIILGAFLAGVIVSLIKETDSSQLYLKLDAIGYGFFIPLFFVMVGVNLNLKSVFAQPKTFYLLPLLLVSVYLVKLAPAILMKVNFSWREVLGAGFLLSSRLSLIIAAGAIGLKLGIISEALYGTIVMVAIITCTFSPVFFNLVIPPHSLPEKETVFIIGTNEKNLFLAQRLKKAGKKVVMVTTASEEAYKKGLTISEEVFYGNPVDPRWLRSIGIEKAKTVVVGTGVEETNIEVCRICKEVFGIDHIVLLTESFLPPEATRAYGAFAVSPEFATVFMAENLVVHPRAFSLFIDEDENLEIAEVELRNPRYFEKPLMKVKLPGDSLILSILRKGEKIIPHGNTVLKQGDIVMLVGSKDCVRMAQSVLGQKLPAS